MAKNYEVNITNGAGSENIISGTYNVDASFVGFDSTTIDPNSLVIDQEHDTYNLTIEASGRLIIHVTEEGTFSGTKVVGATFIRCDVDGNTHGSIQTSNEQGELVLEKVPWDLTNPPIIYYKQLSSDGNHEYDGTLKNTTLTQNVKTIEVMNSLPSSKTINIVDKYYSDLPIETGTVTLSN